MLEAEFGGDLFRRERRNTHLTQLGDRMLPILRQCYESAQSAKAVASAVKTGETSSLRIAIGDAVDIALIAPQLKELTRALKGLELVIVRGSQEKIEGDLKSGAADVAVTVPFDRPWERLEAWPLFSEPFVFACSKSHRLSGRGRVEADELLDEPFIIETNQEVMTRLLAFHRSHHIPASACHRVSSEHDCIALVEAGLGIAFLPASAHRSDRITSICFDDLKLARSICVYGVSGRRRSLAANTFLQLMRTADWSTMAAKRVTQEKQPVPDIRLNSIAFVPSA